MRRRSHHLCSLLQADTGPGVRRVRALLLALVLGVWGNLPALAASPAAGPDERRERALPRFAGRLLDGGTASTDLFRKRRGILLLFSATHEDASRAARIITRIYADARAANAAFLGVSGDADPAVAQAFVRRHELKFPVLADPEGSIAARLRAPPGAPTLLVVDAEGYIISGFLGLESRESEIEAAYEAELRRVLRLERENDPLQQSFGLRPRAPSFALLDKIDHIRHGSDKPEKGAR